MTAIDYHPPGAPSGKPDSFIARLLRVREVPICFVILLILLLTTVVDHQFCSRGNFRDILLWMPLVVIVAMGEMMVIVARGVDVSVGSIMGLSGMIVGELFKHHVIDSVYLGALLAMAIGAVLGSINGTLIAVCKVPPIVATLGTLGAYRGLVHIVCQGYQINAYELPPSLDDWSIDGPFHQTLIPWLVIIAALVAVAALLFLRYTITGRNIFTVGGNPEAARLRGIPVVGVTFLVYVIAGLCAGLAGILYASRFGTLNPQDVGSGFELVVISAVVVGGVSIFGGVGSVVGVLLGSLLLAVIYTALTALNVADAWQSTSYGVVILLAVIFDDLMSRRGARQ
jgi:rhamnose transport system permease protein